MRLRHLGLTLVIVTAVSASCGRCAAPPPPEEENRPPIIVEESSLKFSTGVEWKEKGSKKKWKTDHAKGKDTVTFDISETNCSLKGGTKAVIHFREGTNLHAFDIILEDDSGKKGPVVVSASDMEQDSTDKKVILFTKTGDIEKAELFKSDGTPAGTPCNYVSGATPKLEILFNH